MRVNKFFRMNGGELIIAIPGRVAIYRVERGVELTTRYRLRFNEHFTEIVFDHPLHPLEEILIDYETESNGLERAIERAIEKLYTKSLD